MIFMRIYTFIYFLFYTIPSYYSRDNFNSEIKHWSSISRSSIDPQNRDQALILNIEIKHWSSISRSSIDAKYWDQALILNIEIKHLSSSRSSIDPQYQDQVFKIIHFHIKVLTADVSEIYLCVYYKILILFIILILCPNLMNLRLKPRVSNPPKTGFNWAPPWILKILIKF